MFDKQAILERLNYHAFYQTHGINFVAWPNNKGEVRARCPFGTHKDKRPSFSVNVNAPGLYKCHACAQEGDVIKFCETKYGDDYAAALGRLAAFIEEKNGTPRSHFNSEIPKLDSWNEVLVWHEVLMQDAERLQALLDRYALTSKEVQEAIIGFDGRHYTIPLMTTKQGDRVAVKRYHWDQEPRALNPEGVEVQLYGAESMLDVPTGSLIIVTEGEFKRLLLIRLGFYAVSGTGGAGTFKPEWAEHFKGKGFNVAILYDVDGKSEEGIEKASDVLLPVTQSLKIIRLPLPGTPDAKDVTDFIKLGRTAEDLRRLIEETPTFERQEPEAEGFAEPLSILLEEPDEPVDWVVEDLLERPSLGFIGGEPKMTKSILGLHIALSVATGMPVFGQFKVPRPRKVLYIQEEDGRRRVKRRAKALLRGIAVPTPSDFVANFRLSIRKGFRIDDAEWRNRLEAELEQFQPELVVFDVFANLHSKEENDQQAMSEITGYFKDIRDRYQCCVLIIHHFGKAAGDGRFTRPNQRLRGSSVLAAASENSLFLSAALDKRIRADHESKEGPVDPFVYAVEGGWDGSDGVRLVYKGEAGFAQTMAKAEAFYAVLCQQYEARGPEGCTYQALGEASGLAENTVRERMKVLIALGKAEPSYVDGVAKDGKKRKITCFIPVRQESPDAGEA